MPPMSHFKCFLGITCQDSLPVKGRVKIPDFSEPEYAVKGTETADMELSLLHMARSMIEICEQ